MKPISITSMMRRISAVALLLFLCASAFAFKDGSYTFSVNSDGESVTITSHDDKNATSIWIPSTAYDADKEKSYDVTAIGSNVFRNYLDLTSITFLASIEYIGQNAFSGCLQLEEFYVPSSVKTLATGVFQGCRSLHSVTLNAGLINLGENSYPYTGVFEDCSSLKEVKLPGTVKYVGSNTFGNCTSLESVDLNYGLLTIGSNAFYNCSSLNKIVIPNTVQEIGSAIFQGCNILEDATIGSKVQSMGNGIFSNCNSLNKVTIENGCSIIGQETFSGCSSLKTIVIPGTVKYINMGAFRDCTSLESVILNEGILYIGENSYPYTGVFQGCNRLKSIKIPTTVINICRNAFYGCTSLESAELSEGLQTISNYAFYNCSSLKSIVIPNTVETVGEEGFVGCSSLASAVVGRKVSSMGARAFQNCKSLSSLTIEEGCSMISEEAFAGCIALPNVSIPGSVQNINMGAFRDCTSLESVTLNEGILYIGENLYPYTGAFQGCNRLKSIKIPSTVINICRNAFYGCISLESAELSEGLQTISNYVFYNCSSLKSIAIPNTVETVGEQVFVGCSNLASAVVGRKVSSMGDRVFQDCKSLTSVTIEDGCSIISEEAFAGCIALPNVSIPGSVQNINMGAFRDCTSLESVILNEGILYIGEDSYPYTGVFQGCLQLSYIYIPSTIKSIKSNTFYGCANLRRFISNASIVPELSNNIWANSSQARATLYVPFDALADYQAAAQWQDFKNIRAIGDEGGEDVYGTCDLVDVPFNSPYFDAVEFLCERGVLNGSGMDGRVSVNDEITRAQMAKVAFWGLYLLNGVTIPNVFVSTLFPTVYQDLNTPNADNEYYYEPARALLYLDYGDGVTPFDRNRLSFKPADKIARIHVLKVLMETFNIAPNVSGTNNPFPDDKDAVSLMNNDPRKFGYLRKAAALGIVSTPNNGQNTQFRPYDTCTRGEAFLMLYRIMQKIEAKKIDMPVPDEKAYFEPLNLTLTTLARGVDFQMGNFNHYTKSSFDIDGTVPLTFSHTYNSYNTSIDDVFFGHRTTNNVDLTYRPLGPGWSHSYDCFVNLITTGNEERAIVHWGSGKIHVYKKENGKYVRESIGIYDELTVSNNEATIKDKSQVVYQFKNLEGNGSELYYLTSVTDRNDNTLTIDYLSGVNGMKVINTVSDGSRSLSFKYLSGTNLLESVKDPLSREIKFGYTYNKNTAEYQLTSFTDAKGQVTKYIYGDAAKISTSRLMARVQLPKGNYVENEYDMNRRLSKTVTGQNNIPTTETSLTVKSQYTDTSISTTSQIQVTREGATSTFNYVFNKDNSITNMTGEEGYELTNSYTDSSHPHLPTAVKSNSSDVEDIKYDDRGNITSVTVKSLDGSKSRKVTMTYSTTNDLLSTTDAMGNTTNFTYDDRGNLVKVEQPEGVTSTMEVNAKGLVTKTTDPMGIVTQYEYNGYGNVTKILLTALNLQTRLEYDLASRITAAYDPLDRKQTYTYDNNDNLLTEVDPLNNTTKYGYDKNDNLTTVTNAKGNTTTMTYDNATDWLLSVTFGSSSEKYEYNKDGTLKTFTKPDGTTMSHTYDNLGRVLSDGANTYSYDNNMRLTTIGNSSSTLNLSYDGFSRLTKVDFSGGDNNTVKYEYNDNNSITALTYPSGNKVRYEYDKLNRMTKVTDWKGNTVTYTYRKDSKLSRVDYSNGMSTVYQYDNVGRLIDKTTTLSDGTVIAGYSFELDKVGNIVSQEFTEPYDSAPLDDESVAYTYNNTNRITKAGDLAFAFDANGNTTQRGDETYEWNSTDRLTRAASVAIEYDPYGLIRSYGDTKYTVDILGDGNVLSDSKTGSSYIYGQGLEMRISKNGEVSYYVTDVRGSVVAIVDASGNITHKYLYDDFGKVVESEEKDFNPFRYVGKYGVMYLTDHQYYMRARHYDPTIGRFLSEDPIWSTNLYPYTDNNPIMAIDPRGEVLSDVVGTTFGVFQGAKTATTLGGYNLVAIAKAAAVTEAEHLKTAAAADALIEGFGTSTTATVTTATTTTATATTTTATTTTVGLGSLATTAAVGLIGGVITGVSWAGSYYLAAKGKIKTAFALGGLGGAAGGAMLGAAIGSIVPGVGTAVGAGVGAICGVVGGLITSGVGTYNYKKQQKSSANQYYYN